MTNIFQEMSELEKKFKFKLLQNIEITITEYDIYWQLPVFCKLLKQKTLHKVRSSKNLNYIANRMLFLSKDLINPFNCKTLLKYCIIYPINAKKVACKKTFSICVDCYGLEWSLINCLKMDREEIEIIKIQNKKKNKIHKCLPISDILKNVVLEYY